MLVLIVKYRFSNHKKRIVGRKTPAISLYSIDIKNTKKHKKTLLGVDKLGNIADNEGRSGGETLDRLNTGKPGRKGKDDIFKGKRIAWTYNTEELGKTS